MHLPFQQPTRLEKEECPTTFFIFLCLQSGSADRRQGIESYNNHAMTVHANLKFGLDSPNATFFPASSSTGYLSRPPSTVGAYEFFISLLCRLLASKGEEEERGTSHQEDWQFPTASSSYDGTHIFFLCEPAPPSSPELLSFHTALHAFSSSEMGEVKETLLWVERNSLFYPTLLLPPILRGNSPPPSEHAFFSF